MSEALFGHPVQEEYAVKRKEEIPLKFLKFFKVVIHVYITFIENHHKLYSKFYQIFRKLYPEFLECSLKWPASNVGVGRCSTVWWYLFVESKDVFNIKRLFDEFINTFLSTTIQNASVVYIGFQHWPQRVWSMLPTPMSVPTFVPMLDTICSTSFRQHP